MNTTLTPQDILDRAEALRPKLESGFRDEIVKSIYSEVEHITRRAVHTQEERKKWDFDQRIDRLVTSPIFGLPLMLVILAAIFWLTITGANVPSKLIADGLFFLEDKAAGLFTQIGIPWWITGFIWHGVYRGLAWVISVMLPPMAIFFPIFTILEDLGYLPRVAFNLDWLFKSAGAHGKQSLTMAMGFGCNAAGVIATRVIEFTARTLDRDLNEQLCAVQRAVSYVDYAGDCLCRGFLPSRGGVDRRGRFGRRRGSHRCIFHPAGFVGALQNGAER